MRFLVTLAKLLRNAYFTEDLLATAYEFFKKPLLGLTSLYCNKLEIKIN